MLWFVDFLLSIEILFLEDILNIVRNQKEHKSVPNAISSLRVIYDI